MANSQITQWIAWAERRIAGVVVREGLVVQLAKVVQGPLVVSFLLRLRRPSPTDVRKVLSLGPALSQSLRTEGVRIQNQDGGIVVEVPSPFPRTPSGDDLAVLSDRLSVAVGLDQWRQPATLNLPDYPVLAFVGPPGRGKSSAMRSGLYALLKGTSVRRVAFLVLAYKRKDWTAFERLDHCLGVVSDPDEAEDALGWLVDDLVPGRSAGTSSVWPAVVVVVDDVVYWTTQRPGLNEPITALSSMGRSEQVFLWLGTQDAGSKRGTAGADNWVTARVVYRPASKTAGARAAGAGGLDLDLLTTQKGDAVLVTDTTIRIATGHVEDDRVQLLGTGGTQTEQRPWTKNNPEPAGTGKNQAEQPRTGSDRPPVVRAGGDVVGGGGPEQSIEQLKQNNLGVPATRSPTADEARTISQVYQRLGSKRKTSFFVYGFYNGTTKSHIDQVVEPGKGVTADNEDEAGPAGPGRGRVGADLPDVIDLNDQTGRRTLEKLQTSGLVKWPDPNTLYTH